ncbi:nucleotidyltransferase domain-containing protein [Bdellovibrionota bacterium FG-2]
MRLDESELEKIRAVAQIFFGKSRGELCLYGSRVDDTLKGGDIDLVFIFETEAERKSASVAPHLVVVALKEKLGERKIDFSIISKEDEKKPFWTLALKNSIVLCSFTHASHTRP